VREPLLDQMMRLRPVPQRAGQFAIRLIPNLRTTAHRTTCRARGSRPLKVPRQRALEAAIRTSEIARGLLLSGTRASNRRFCVVELDRRRPDEHQPQALSWPGLQKLGGEMSMPLGRAASFALSQIACSWS
jgi:hypothetical protein